MWFSVASAHPYLIFSNRNQLRRLNLHTSEYNVLVFNLHNSIAVDFHYNQSAIYWTDVVDDKIYRGWLDENSPNAGMGILYKTSIMFITLLTKVYYGNKQKYYWNKQNFIMEMNLLQK